MERNVFFVQAKQCVTSASHPEGLISDMTGYPKTFDSRTYGTEENPNGDPGKAFKMARADYLSCLSGILSADNPARVMATVTLARADGKTIYHESMGGFPDMTPPEPEPEPPEDEEETPAE